MKAKKIFVATDIHGSLFAMEQVIDALKYEQADQVVFLGDIYYHGPRNPFPEAYMPMSVCELLKNIKQPLTVIKGNCDSEVDEMISEFLFKKRKVINFFGNKICFEHGHRLKSAEEYKKEDIKAVIFGHTHINQVTKKNDVYFVNVASTSLPKENAEKSYCVIEKNNKENPVTISIKNLEHQVIFSAII